MLIPTHDLFQKLPEQIRNSYHTKYHSNFNSECLICSNKKIRMTFNQGWSSEENNYCKAVTCSEECYQYLLLTLC